MEIPSEMKGRVSHPRPAQAQRKELGQGKAKCPQPVKETTITPS